MAGIKVEMLLELDELIFTPDKVSGQVLLLELDESAEVRRYVHDIVEVHVGVFILIAFFFKFRSLPVFLKLGIMLMLGYKVRTFTDRRAGEKPIPDNLENVLNKSQMTKLLQLESMGWRLWFVRRPLFQSVMPVLYDPTNSFTGVIEDSGDCNVDHNLQFRPDA